MKKKTAALGIGGAIGFGLAWKYLSRAGTADFTDKIHHAENSHFIEIDGARVHFQEFGDPTDPTLLLIHGYTASTYVWHNVAPQLAENFHIIAADLIGFGYSEKPRVFDYSIASHARMLIRLMDRLEIGRATLVGSSYGGAVASTAALDYPERVERLVLVDAVCNDEVLNHPLLKLVAIPFVGDLLAPFIVDSKRLLKYRMRNTLAPENHHLITPERLDSVHRPQNAADAHRSFLATARAWNACRIQDDAQFITQPTLIVWGDKDKVIPLHNGEKLFDSIPNSRFVILRNCGHVPPEEKPEIFVNLVTEFCRNGKGILEESKEMQ